MSDLARMNKILEQLEVLAEEVDGFQNQRVAEYVETTLRTAYEDIQVECLAQLDHGFQVV